MMTAAAAALGISVGSLLGWIEAGQAIYRGAKLVGRLNDYTQKQLEAMTPEQRARAESALQNHETFRGGII